MENALLGGFNWFQSLIGIRGDCNVTVAIAAGTTRATYVSIPDRD